MSDALRLRLPFFPLSGKMQASLVITQRQSRDPVLIGSRIPMLGTSVRPPLAEDDRAGSTVTKVKKEEKSG
jgi:hypothetical protein